MSYPTEDELRRKVLAEIAALSEGEDSDGAQRLWEAIHETEGEGAAGEVPLPLMNRMETPE